MRRTGIPILIAMGLLLAAGLKAQEVYRRTGQMILVKGRLQAAYGDTLRIVRPAGDGVIPIGRAIFDRWTGNDTALWIVEEKSGYAADNGDRIVASVLSGPEPQDRSRIFSTGEDDTAPSKRPYYFTRGIRRGRIGLSMGANAGLMIAASDTAYDGRGPYLYPEAALMLDVSGMRIGISAGNIRRQFTMTVSDSVFDPQQGWKPRRRDIPHNVHLIPLLLDITVMPLRFGNPYGGAQPYLSLAPGITVSLGDREERISIALALKGGIEFYFGEWWVLDMEIRYVIIPDGYGFFCTLGGLRFRVPFR